MDNRERRQQVIDTANAMMQTDKRAALAVYESVCPVDHARCTERCRAAHRTLLAALSDANALYSSRIWGDAS